MDADVLATLEERTVMFATVPLANKFLTLLTLCSVFVSPGFRFASKLTKVEPDCRLTVRN